MKISFADPVPSSLSYAYSWRFEETPEFTRGERCIENKADPSGPAGYEWITLLTREKYPAGTTVSASCSFEGDAAPLLVLARDTETDQRGVIRYGEYLEVVLWKNGINVWQMHTADRVVTWKKLLGAEFSAAEGKIHTVTVRTRSDGITVEACGQKLHLYIPDFYSTFHAGINACEGICRFYDFTAE